MSRPSLLLPEAWPSRVRSAVVHAVAIARTSLVLARSEAENHFDERLRLRAEVDRLRTESALLREEIRIKDARMERLPPQRRPHYPPIERLGILELRAARGWTVSETARRLLVTAVTVASWNSRLDEEGPDSLLRVPVPVNRFPEFVAYVVRRLRALCPSMGTRRIARVLARAGLHLGRTTVRRMLQPAPKRPTPVATRKPECVVAARGPNHMAWLNAERPHTFLRGATPDEVYFGRMPASRRPRLEPRARWPRRSSCAQPHALVRGRPGGLPIELRVDRHEGRAHLPIV